MEKQTQQIQQRLPSTKQWLSNLNAGIVSGQFLKVPSFSNWSDDH